MERWKASIIIVAVALVVGATITLANEPKLKACKNLTTQEIVLVEKGFVCPFGFIEI